MPHRSLVKIGGSLLSTGRLREVIAKIIRQSSLTWPVFTVGGGTIADQVATWELFHPLTEEQSHWLALEAIGVNEQLLLTLFPEWRLVRSLSQLEAAERDGKVSLICTKCFFKWGEREFGQRLTHSWSATSDSIAAWFAELIEAENLTLVKSVDWIPGLSWEEAHKRKLVDGEFARVISSEMPVRWLNGRRDPLQFVACAP